MKEKLSPRERLLIAMTGGKPDRVPCTPDFSNMIPCRLTRRPFWDIYLHQNPPLWKAYLHAADYFGIDAWCVYAGLDFQWSGGVKWEHQITSQTPEFIIQRHRILTPDGELEGETTFYPDNPPTATRKPITDLPSQFRRLRHLLQAPTGYQADSAREQKAAVGERYAFGTSISYPGFHSWIGFFEGGLEPLAYTAMDYPDLLEELRELEERRFLKQLEMIIDSRMFDYVLLGASGSITLASPELFDRYAFPTLQKITRICKQAGLPTMLHSCGKELHLVKRCAEESDLNCVNPLEVPPMGDCILADVKRLYGRKLALMGNLHTTEVMLMGSVEAVKAAARKAIDEAAEGGGFILSTGDQCGRDTPDENLRALVEVARTYGRY